MTEPYRCWRTANSIGFPALKPDSNVVKISVIGVGMRSHAGVAKQMFQTLADKGINIQVISTSEIKVSVLIAAEYTELALRALHTAYGLDAADDRGHRRSGFSTAKRASQRGETSRYSAPSSTGLGARP